MRCKLQAFLAVMLVGSLAASAAVAQQTTVPKPNVPQQFTQEQLAQMAIASRLYGGRHSHPGGVTGPAQAMAAQQMQAQRMAMQQQMVAAQIAAAKRAEKKEKTREAAMALREKKEKDKASRGK
jgi:hypothetical protein